MSVAILPRGATIFENSFTFQLDFTLGSHWKFTYFGGHFGIQENEKSNQCIFGQFSISRFITLPDMYPCKGKPSCNNIDVFAILLGKCI